MDEKQYCAVIIDENLPIGLVANTAAILGLSVGKECRSLIGDNTVDGEGNIYPGIVAKPVPILQGNKKVFNYIMEQLPMKKYIGVGFVGFTDLAQKCKTYDEYKQKMSSVSKEDINFIGLAIYGKDKKIKSLTGGLKLLR